MITKGNETTICANVVLDDTGELIIGNQTHIAEDVVIYTHHHGESERWWIPEMNKNIIKTKLEIGDNVFIGRRAYILPSCSKIGNKSTIGAMSVVTCDIPGGEVWAGCPARFIKKYQND
jgi:hypothetical protein